MNHIFKNLQESDMPLQLRDTYFYRVRAITYSNILIFTFFGGLLFVGSCLFFGFGISYSLSLSLLSKINPNKSMSTLVKFLMLSFFMKGQTSMIICLSLDVDDNCGRCSASSPCPGHSALWCTSTHLQLERS
jgi:hypothetical protein